MFNTNWQRAHVWKRKNARRHATNVMPFSETRSTGKIEVEGEDMSCYTHQTLFQQQLYNPDLKPVLYMPALSEVGFHCSHYLFSINSCQTLLSNVPPVNQSIAATHRNKDKVPLVITAKSKICTYIQVRQHLCMADRESGQSCKTCSVIRLHHQCTLSFLNYICIKYQAPT